MKKSELKQIIREEIKKLNETGEWDASEGRTWLFGLKYGMKNLQRLTKGKAKFKSAKGFDMYQGPYAIMNINGRDYTVWTFGEADDYWIEDYPVDNTSKISGYSKGAAGTVKELAYIINSGRTK